MAFAKGRGAGLVEDALDLFGIAEDLFRHLGRKAKRPGETKKTKKNRPERNFGQTPPPRSGSKRR